MENLFKEYERQKQRIKDLEGEIMHWLGYGLLLGFVLGVAFGTYFFSIFNQ